MAIVGGQNEGKKELAGRSVYAAVSKTVLEAYAGCQLGYTVGTRLSAVTRGEACEPGTRGSVVAVPESDEES